MNIRKSQACDLGLTQETKFQLEAKHGWVQNEAGMNSLYDPMNEVKDQNIYNYEISQQKHAEFFDIESST